MKIKNKKNILLIISFVIIIGLIVLFIMTFLKTSSKNEETSNKIELPYSFDENDKNAYDKLTTESENNKIKDVKLSQKDRIYWNDLLNELSYMQKIDTIYPSQFFQEDVSYVKIALYSDGVPTEEITEEDVNNNFILGLGNSTGYKKSIENINNYFYDVFGIEQDRINYNTLDTFFEDGEYLVIGNDYIYFTELEPLNEKIYIATDCKKNGKYYSVYIYEYDVDDDNREALEEMLESGKIDEKYSCSSEYTIIVKKQEDEMIIKYKYKNKEEIDKLDESRTSFADSVEALIETIDRQNSPANAHAVTNTTDENSVQNSDEDEEKRKIAEELGIE